MNLSRRTIIQWLAALAAYPAGAQEAVSGDKAAASDPSVIKHHLEAANLSISLTDQGHILRLKLGHEGFELPFHACTVLGDCRASGDATPRLLPGGGIEFSRLYTHEETHDQCTVVDRFVPTSSSIRWEVEIRGSGSPWSTPIQTQLAWLDASAATFWTAWDSAPGAKAGWSDPLVHAPFADRTLRYGGLLDEEHVFSIPIFSIFEGSKDVGLSLVQAPETTLLDMSLKTTSLGDAILTRTNHRISQGGIVKFSMDLVAHAADWRAGLGWMVDRYPSYFDPPNKNVYALDGGGAYSAFQGDLDVPKLRKMAFSLNWNAHFDFPFHGMSIPPVPATEEWQSWYQQPASLKKMAEYDDRMKRDGFNVLEYFVMTEAGNYIQEEPPPRKAKSDADLWRDGNDFIHYEVPAAVLRDRDGKIKYSNWFNNVVLDPAEPVWQNILLEQIRTLVKELPNSAGVCIDRMDWLTLYNTHRDDGVSWVEGRPARSLLVSWKETLSKVAAILHQAGKFVYANTLVRRIDANEYLDGIYDEYGDFPKMLNLTALMAVRKPAIAWTRDINTLRPDPNAMFQRHLHLGVFPTIPFPGADHTIVSDAWVDQHYLDYGPLLNAMRGKKWVLEPHVISVEGNTACANLFKVPGGYAVPITFAHDASEVVVVLRGIPTGKERLLSANAIHPGEDKAIALRAESNGTNLTLRVPVHRGCALVTLECSAASDM
jgi:hypothetical protein